MIASSCFSVGLDCVPRALLKIFRKTKGARVWDVDGNQYIDMVMGCGPVTIGHSNEKINKAVQKQLNKGILFSMLNPLEVELAKLLIQNIPSAEMVKLSKCKHFAQHQ